MKIIALGLIFLSGLAHADDVLIKNYQTANQSVEHLNYLTNKYLSKRLVRFASLKPVEINPYAINAKNIRALIDGKEYTFRGSLSTRTYYDGSSFVTLDSWHGLSDTGDIPDFEFRDAAYIYGLIDIDGKSYSLKPDAIYSIVHLDPKIQVAARQAWVNRGLENNFVKSASPIVQYVGYCNRRKMVLQKPVRNCKEALEN